MRFEIGWRELKSTQDAPATGKLPRKEFFLRAMSRTPTGRSSKKGLREHYPE
ncbi:MAG: hypothetical protein ACOZF2_00375 [Thermodesulfobacteriota bacterium]